MKCHIPCISKTRTTQIVVINELKVVEWVQVELISHVQPQSTISRVLELGCLIVIVTSNKTTTATTFSRRQGRLPNRHIVGGCWCIGSYGCDPRSAKQASNKALKTNFWVYFQLHWSWSGGVMYSQFIPHIRCSLYPSASRSVRGDLHTRSLTVVP